MLHNMDTVLQSGFVMEIADYGLLLFNVEI